MNIFRIFKVPSEAVTSRSLLKKTKKKNKTFFHEKNMRSNSFQMASGYFWSKTLQAAREEFSLNRFEPTSLTEWEECVIVAGKALPQLVQCTIFQLVYASFFPRVVISEPLGLFIMTIWMFQPGILANQSVCHPCAWLI